MSICNFRFNDSNYTDDQNKSKRILQIANEILCRDIKIVYFVNIRSDFFKFINHQEIALLKASGFSGGLIGFEAANEYDLKLYNKTNTVDNNLKAADIFTSNCFDIECGFINFNPFSSMDSIYKNTNFLYKYGFLNCYNNLTMVRLYKNTSLYNSVKSNGLLLNDAGAYRFKNNKISNIVNFINDFYIPAISQKNITTIKYFAVYWNMELTNLINVFKNHYFDEKAEKMVSECKVEANSILNEFNEQNYKWFLKVLESNDDYSSFNNELPLGDVENYINRLKRSRSLLMKRLIVHNHVYSQLL